MLLFRIHASEMPKNSQLKYPLCKHSPQPDKGVTATYSAEWRLLSQIFTDRETAASC